ncbi:integrator complex subunit 11 [Dendrobium catenatum]|uniref:Integrator complex subunit 11 n=1 Tax=Dendrobium catenatum TaxID=906689 RepID=A0A2I0VS85_9ASPA|nr:integrator complex subunit 11 [Dendrobium catenatum]
MIATVYGKKDVMKRRELWSNLDEVSNRKLPFIVGGDFNCILSQDDKRGGRKFAFSQGPKEMADFLNVNDLHDVGFVGQKYTWCNNKSGGDRILERLDRCFLNSIAINKINNAVVRHLARVASDHCPIVLKILDNQFQKVGIIKFEDVWISFKASSLIIERVWRKKQISDEEILEVIKGLGKNKSPGHDGITYSFLKHYWNIVGIDVCKAIKEFFTSGIVSNSWKETLIVLISKISNPLSPEAFRPISLCNSIYKVVAKVLLNRLMVVIPKLIFEEQVAFMKGRSISEHILLAQEVINKMRICKSKEGMVAIKIDMEQAYDSMCWSTLEGVLRSSGFPEKFIRLILECIVEPRFSIIINGNLSNWIEGKSGFRQGCPLSPFLFILCS